MKLFLTGCAMALWLNVAGAAESTQTATSTQARLNWAEKMFDQLSHDFGVVTHGSEVRHQVRIHNPYKEAITVTDVGTTCGCTAGSVSKKVLQPREEAFVNIQMNTLKFKRHKNSNVDVTLAFSGGTQKVRVPIHAYIREDVIVSEDTVDFGPTASGAAGTKTVSVTYQGEAPWKITGAKSEDSSIKVEVAKPVHVTEGIRYDLTVTLAKDAPVGRLAKRIIVSTEEPSRSYFPINVHAEIESAIVVATPVVKLGEVAARTEKTARVVLRGRQPFSIVSVKADDETQPAQSASEAAKAVHVVPILVTTPAKEGAFSIDFEINIAGKQAPVMCRVEGEVVGAAAGSPLLTSQP